MGSKIKLSYVKKENQLGMSLGKASYKLRKMVMFNLLKKYGENICYRCGTEIDKCRDMSIDHKKDWLDKDVNLFWDVNNVVFSHLTCNAKHGKKHRNYGSKNHYSKLDEDDVILISTLIPYMSNTSISVMFSVHRTTIRDIRNGRSWSHLTGF